MSLTQAPGSVHWIEVTDRPLQVAQHLAAVEDPRCGAVATFMGKVRNHDPQMPGTVTSISYSAHPDAKTVLERIVAEVVEAGSAHGPLRVAVSHRIGDLAVGDLALLVCVASAHRAQAYETSRQIVERIKVELPVWKKQYGADGSSRWSGI